MNESSHIVAETATRIFTDLADPQAINSAQDGHWREPLWRALTDAGLTLEQQRSLELQRQKHGDGERPVRDVVTGGEQRLCRLDRSGCWRHRGQRSAAATARRASTPTR